MIIHLQKINFKNIFIVALSIYMFLVSIFFSFATKPIKDNNNNSGFYLSFSHLHIAQLTNIIEYLDK
jgi:hypothetical protein